MRMLPSGRLHREKQTTSKPTSTILWHLNASCFQQMHLLMFFGSSGATFHPPSSTSCCENVPIFQRRHDSGSTTKPATLGRWWLVQLNAGFHFFQDTVVPRNWKFLHWIIGKWKKIHGTNGKWHILKINNKTLNKEQHINYIRKNITWILENVP